MNIHKSKIITAVLLTFITLVSMGIFYISYLLNNESEEQNNSQPRIVKTKAANVTYKKTIDLNEPTIFQPELTPTSSLINNLSITPIISPTVTHNTPTPTEIIIAKANPFTPTPSSSPTPTSVKVNSLPETGYINNALIIFTVSSLLVFFSFLF